jgi:hypothetical protein
LVAGSRWSHETYLLYLFDQTMLASEGVVDIIVHDYS